MSDLFEIVYVSQASAELLPGELFQILVAARKNNTRKQITGLLLSDGACFMQILEGSEGAVDTTFNRIRTDNRHRDVRVLRRGPIDSRAFAEWAMGSVQLERFREHVEGLKPISEVASRNDEDFERVRGLIEDFRSGRYRDFVE
ncbi:MAG: BLUF domain-containing protein [Polyangiaceae bacterium]|nr:BLUF domain-containing protein [Myxococcales bacterium]MCB9584532.1 BLUF domain-containing protein [Polyangiaceae bacterium]